MKALLMAGGAVIMFGCERSPDTGQAQSASIETRHLTSAEYEGFIATRGKLVAVMFHAEWCGPCRQLGPVVEEVVGEFEGKVVFGMINVDDSSELARSHGVSGIPDLRLYRDGVMMDAMKGAIPKEELRNRLSIQVVRMDTSGSSEAVREKE